MVDKEQEQQHYTHAMQLVTTSIMPMVLHTAIQLNVFDIIAKAGPGAHLSPSEIASQLSTRNPQAPGMLDRMLRLLVGYSILTCTVVADDRRGGVRRLYGLAPVAKYFIPNEDGMSLGPLIALGQEKVTFECWLGLKTAVLEGGLAFNNAHGKHFFEYAESDLRFNKVFSEAMSNHTTILVKQILEHYKGFERLKKLVDVGGNIGINLNMIVSRYPSIKGINYDQPHVVQHAPSYPGVEHVGGDMFENVPEGDAIFMKWILHNWSDEHCLKLLKNCYKALPESGKVIVVEEMLPVKPETGSSNISTSQMDLLMMTMIPGGRERSEEEFRAMAKEAGFRNITLCCFVCNFWVMEFYK